MFITKHLLGFQPKTSLVAFIRHLSYIVFISLALAGCSNATPPTGEAQYPMEDQYALSIREEYAECRRNNNPMAKFFCNCRILEKQCKGPRKLQHGDWNTVEFWPSDDPAEREVQFILFLSYDILGDLAPLDTGVVMTCVNGISELNAFVGNDIDAESKPVVNIDNVKFEATLDIAGDDHVLGFVDNRKAYKAMRKSHRLTVSFFEIGGTEKNLEFDTLGFDEAAKGWETLCSPVKI